ncbi:hypothetical protein FisN_31Hh027 [Fistulifera solaris]|uniref:Chitin-binding type-4 domain-containing protein n=1 Tax=Fistulifera solaris TaxID=1519565 RepID=A0A1Z5JWV0_FISSO|nr:hypothetical protein FisN_31Hh027 [Fistulifera solaris]|eukprot:GAX18221.1 hypothetical protein FisN_31Hh027 [Fistulifera solaris]
MFRSLTSIAFVLMTWMPSSVESHGSLLLPRSRNEVARQEGTNGEKSGVPVKEYCWQCLNRNNGVCGYVDEKDYDAWVDSTGKPMPWKPQATYQRGQVITVSTGVWAYHWGHVELRACPNGRQSTQACLDSYPLEFVEDVDYDMPKDPKYPDRGYLAERYETYTMKFRLPDNLVGDQVLLQWRYVTSNSCLPPGYKEYFTNVSYDPVRSDLKRAQCALPYSQDGLGKPEQFWNCAEISVLDGPGSPQVSAPVKAPVTAPVKAPVATPVKVPVPSPVKPPVVSPVKAPVTAPVGTTCVPRFQNCIQKACCAGLVCEKKTAYFSQCVIP